MIAFILKYMHNLRPRKQPNSSIELGNIDSSNNITSDTEVKQRKRSKSQLNNKRSKLQKVSNNECNPLFNPKSFTKGSEYKGIHDSSDSESSEYIRQSPDDEHIHSIDDECANTQPEKRKKKQKHQRVMEESSEEEEYDESSDESDEEEEFNEESSESGEEIDDDGQIDTGYDPDASEYFDVSTEPLTNIITQRLKTMFPDLSKEDLNSAVKKALEKAKGDLVDEYCEAVPKDTSWKAGVDAKEAKSWSRSSRIYDRALRIMFLQFLRF